MAKKKFRRMKRYNDTQDVKPTVFDITKDENMFLSPSCASKDSYRPFERMSAALMDLTFAALAKPPKS